MRMWASCYKWISLKWNKNMLDVSWESIYDIVNCKWWRNNLEWLAIYRKNPSADHGLDGTKGLVPSLLEFGSVQLWQEILQVSLPNQAKILPYLPLSNNLNQISIISSKITQTSKNHDATHDVIKLSNYIQNYYKV